MLDFSCFVDGSKLWLRWYHNGKFFYNKKIKSTHQSTLGQCLQDDEELWNQDRCHEGVREKGQDQ